MTYKSLFLSVSKRFVQIQWMQTHLTNTLIKKHLVFWYLNLFVFPFIYFFIKVCWRNECSFFYLLPVHSSGIWIFKKYIYLLLTVLALCCCGRGLLSSWGVWASHCSGFCCCGAWASWWACLSSWDSQA